MELKERSEIRKTKIVCTLGPATSSPEQIERLINAGMDVARLNFSHGDRETHRKTIRSIRRIAADLNREVGILQDLGGPKIRLGKLKTQPLELNIGDTIVLKTGESSDSDIIPVNYPYLVEDVFAGNRILLADGLVELEVEKIESQNVVCKVIVGGEIQSHKGVNLPTSDLRVPSVTEKDHLDLIVGLEEDVDFVALSFVRHEKDIEPVRKQMEEKGKRPMLIAKIEKPQAIERFEEILTHVDAVMVARGDLGVEMPLEEVPIIQKHIIRLARQSAKPVITATQMLRSMVNAPRPTRAEATDVANAILDGTDAVMLSEETAIGDYPEEAVRVLDRIARMTEPNLTEADFLQESMYDYNAAPETEAAISRAACRLAGDLNAAAVVAATTSGSTARNVSRFRPSTPIIGLTPFVAVQRQLKLSWGVTPVLTDTIRDTDQIFSLAGSSAVSAKIARAGDKLVVTAGIPVGETGITNLVRVLKV